MALNHIPKSVIAPRDVTCAVCTAPIRKGEPCVAAQGTLPRHFYHDECYAD